MEDIGHVRLAKSKFLQDMHLYDSIRQPGCVYEFTKRTGDYYVCAQCKKLGKCELLLFERVR